MINIAVCDDNQHFLGYIEQEIIEALKSIEKAAKVHKFINGIKLLESYSKSDKPFDIIFLDIDMPKIDGIEAAEIIRKKDKKTILIFLTSMEDEVYKTFRYNTFRFIRKSNIDTELKEALENAMGKLTYEKCIFKTVEGEVALYINDILYFEFIDRNVQIITFNHKYMSNIRRFKDIEDVFQSREFIKIHRSCMINENYIKCIGDLDVTLDNGKKLPVSRYRIEEVKKRFVKVARGG